MAVPSVYLVNKDGLNFNFTFHTSISSFTASLEPSLCASPLLVVASPTCNLQNSSSSSFEVYFSQASFVFPHSEFQKFKAFLESVKSIKAAA